MNAIPVPGGPAVIVDPYSSGALFAPAFHEAGVDTVALVSGPEPPDVYAASYRPGDFTEIVEYQGDPQPVIARLRTMQPRCVLAGCESGVELADLIAPHIDPGLANLPELRAARRHKGAMAAEVDRAGLAGIRQICTGDVGAVAAWAERHRLQGADLVIKPPKSASTDGVVRVPAGGDWRSAFLGLLGTTNRLGIVNDEVIVQEYAAGTEYVVDTVSVAGRHSIADLCRYRKVDNGGHMAVYDAMDWLPYDRAAHGGLFDYALAVLDAVGMRTGAAHIEIMDTAAGPRLLEIGARPHGGGHPRFSRLATGDSQVDRLVRHFAAGEEPETGYSLRRWVRVVFFMATRSGILRNAGDYELVRDLPTCHHASIGVRSGDRIVATRDLFGTLDLGFVVLVADRQSDIEADYAAVRAIEEALVIDPVPGHLSFA